MATPNTPIEQRMARLEGAYEQINLRLVELGDELRALRTETTAGFQDLRAEMRRMGERSDRLMYAILGFLAAGIIALVAALLK